MSRPLTQRPAFFALAGAITIAFSAILVDLADVEPSTAAVFRCAYALPLLALLALRERRRHGPPPARHWRYGAAAGVFFAADLILWHHAIGDVGAGLATTLANLQVVFVAITAWVLLGEKPSPRVVLAVPLVFVGVGLISGVVGEGAYGDDPALGALYGVLTAVAYTGFILVLREMGRDLRRPAAPLFAATLFATLVAAVAGTLLGEVDFAPSWPAHGWLFTLALTSQVLGWLLIAVALPRLPASLTSIVLTVQPVGSVLLGVVLLGEDPAPLQLAGVAVIVAGIVIATRRSAAGTVA
ncbi:MAG TPA: DMT family transporter [Solirubrobacteraceae bacterium]|nr:DMT family transporter [Solirubrobacteraceae bacterium]